MHAHDAHNCPPHLIFSPIHAFEDMDAMGLFVAPLMLFELTLTAAPCLDALNALGVAPSLHQLAVAVTPARAWGGAALLAVIWLSTALLSVPTHDALLRARGEEEGGAAAGTSTKMRRDELWQRLVRTNWVRTVCWSIRGLGAAETVLWAASRMNSEK